MSMHKVTLNSLNSGACVELFSEEFDKILENIADENTPPDAVREIKLICKIKPTKDRRSAMTQLQISSKLAPIKPHESIIIFSNDDGKKEAYTSDLKQNDLPNLIELKKEKGEN